MWLKFQTVRQPFPTDGMIDKILLECFYRDLDMKKKYCWLIFQWQFATQTLRRSSQVFYDMIEVNKEIKKKQ